MYFEEGWEPFPDAFQVLEELGDLRLGIVTNGSRAQQHAKIDKMGMRDHFECVVTSDDAGFAKPDPRIFWWACAELECTAAECTFVGDSWASDIVGSRSVGMKAVWVNRHGEEVPGSSEDVPVIESLAVLPRLSSTSRS